MNKRLAYVTSFGACSPNCQQGEPIGLSDGRVLQANRCPNFNVCVIAGRYALHGEDTLTETEEAEHINAIYTAEELLQHDDGKPVLAIGGVFKEIIAAPFLFQEGALKPQAAPDAFYDQYFDNPFSTQ